MGVGLAWVRARVWVGFGLGLGGLAVGRWECWVGRGSGSIWFFGLRVLPGRQKARRQERLRRRGAFSSWTSTEDTGKI